MKHCMRRILAVMLLIAIALPLYACSGNNNTQRRSDKTNTLYVGYVGTSFPSSYMPWQSRDGIAPTISSINQEELINRCLDGAGSTYSAGLVSNTLESMYNPESDILRGDYEARLAEANAILDTYTTEKDSLGYRIYNGKRISYEVLGNPGEQDTISYLQIQLQKIGIELKYAPSGNSPENTYLYHSRFDMTLQGITFSLSTVDIMLNAHFVNLNKSSNYGRIVDEELAAKINKMRNTLNLDEKNALLKDIQVDIANLYYKIPLYSANVTSVARTDRFTGYVVSPSQTAFSLETLQNLEFVGG